MIGLEVTVIFMTFSISFFYVILLPFTKVKSNIYHLQKDFLGKCYEKTLVTEIAILTQNWSIIHDSLLMGLYQDQQTAVNNGGVSRGTPDT